MHVDGTSTDAVMQDAIEGFADGRYMVLFNRQLMTEGFDLSAQVNRDVPIEACILLRPTQSLALYMQMVGRALRVKPKPAVILTTQVVRCVTACRMMSANGALQVARNASAATKSRQCLSSNAVLLWRV